MYGEALRVNTKADLDSNGLWLEMMTDYGWHSGVYLFIRGNSFVLHDNIWSKLAIEW